jgi:N-ethylmaleimide reductase
MKKKVFSWFEPLLIGDIEAKNRVLMASLTRLRGNDEGVGNEEIIKYYKQRAGFGIIFTEASQINLEGHGYPGACGIETKE